MRRSNLRPLAALVAAYAIALQAMLSGMLLASQAGYATALTGIICNASQGEPTGAPADPMPCCSGAMCSPSASDPVSPPVVISPILSEKPAYRSPARTSEALVFENSGPQQPRAPPSA